MEDQNRKFNEERLKYEKTITEMDIKIKRQNQTFYQ